MNIQNKNENNLQSKAVHRDIFCWICHKNAGKSKNCTKCFRYFHSQCIGSPRLSLANQKTDATETFICSVCNVLETSKPAYVGKRTILDLLKYTMDDIMANPELKVLLDQMTKRNNLHTINLAEISQKIKDKRYDSFYAFVVDIETIYHNVIISLDYFAASKGDQLFKAVQILLVFATNQVETIQGCSECYENKYKYPNQWRSMTCKKPHIILWAKTSRNSEFCSRIYKKGFLNWPVKLITIADNVSKVVAFGCSEFLDVAKCTIYSNDKNYEKLRDSDYFETKSAFKELCAYIENVEKKFGRFNGKLEDDSFFPDQLYRHIKDMFPDYNDPSVQPKINNVRCGARKRRCFSVDVQSTRARFDHRDDHILPAKMKKQTSKSDNMDHENDTRTKKLLNELDSLKEKINDLTKENHKLTLHLEAESNIADIKIDYVHEKNLPENSRSQIIAEMNEKIANITKSNRNLKIRLNMEKVRSENLIKDLKKKHAEELVTTIDKEWKKCEDRFSKIFKNMQNKSKNCKACDEVFEAGLFCSEKCKKIWIRLNDLDST